VVDSSLLGSFVVRDDLHTFFAFAAIAWL